MFKINNKDTRTTTLAYFTSCFQCFYCQLRAGKCQLGRFTATDSVQSNLRDDDDVIVGMLCDFGKTL